MPSGAGEDAAVPQESSRSLGSDQRTPELLLREALPGGRLDLTARLHEIGWTADQHDAWTRGAPAVVLCDPADERVRGAGLACELRPGTFQLLAITLASDLADRDALYERIMRALGDRVRRLGGEHLVASLRGSGLSGAQLEAAGFRLAPGSVASTTSPEPVGFGYLEL
jgi:hypothetical protein